MYVRFKLLVTVLAIAPFCFGQESGPPEKPKDASPEATPQPAADGGANPAAAQRTQLNLLGQEDARSGEARRNENVQFNLIDTNALQDLNTRIGASATIITDMDASRNFWGAEYGSRPPPAPHLPPTRSAGGVHGRAFWTHGNSLFSARSFFQVGGVQPARENRYGFNVTAPIWKGAHLTANASQQKNRGQVNGNILVPLPDERTPLASDPALRQVVQRLLDAFPAELPNRPDIDERALNTNAPQTIDTDAATFRLDQDLSGGNRLAASYAFTSQSVDSFQFIKGQNPDTEIKSHRPRLTWTRTWSPQTVSDVSLGFDRVGTLLTPEPNNFGPTVVTGGALTTIGPAPLIPTDRAINTWRYAARLRQTAGNHQLSYGVELNRIQNNGFEQMAFRGTVIFGSNENRDAITNLRYGTPIQMPVTIGNFIRGYRSWAAAYYVGDTWKASRDLTLTLGLRYELATRPVEVNALETLPYSCDCNNFAPRFGFAYRLGDNAGVVRGAYGISYGQIFPVTYGQVRLNAPNVYRIVVPSPDLTNPLGGVTIDDVPAGVRSSLYDYADNLVEPYSHQYTLSWERPLGSHVNLQLGYVGSRTHKIFQAWFNNRARRPEGIPVTSRTINLRRPNSTYNDIFRFHNASRAYYDAARVTLVVRNWKGVTVDAAYWFSKSLDLGADYANTMNGGDARRALSQWEDDVHADTKGRSTFDQPHSFLMRFAYTTPQLAGAPFWSRKAFGGWDVSAVTLLKNGTPFDIGTGSDGPGFGNVDGQNSDRPHILDPSILGSTIGHPDTSQQKLPRSAFAFLGPDDLRGSLGIRVFRRGRIANVNASLSRSWAFGGDARVTFRAESLNFLNTPQFAEPTVDLASPSFGKITNTLNDGRTFRFTLELNF